MALLLIVGSCTSSKQEIHSPLNILFIGVDTLRADALGAYGQSSAYTPALDTLSRRGVTFCEVICQAPITQPSFASIFTSLYPREHGALNNTYALADRHVTLAEVLSSHGYQTAAVISGKVLEKAFGMNQGFAFYEDDFFATRKADEAVDLTLKWLEARNPEQPFFFWLHCIDPHLPYNAPKEYKALNGLTSGFTGIQPQEALSWYHEQKQPDDKDLTKIESHYLAEVSFMDAQLGRLFRYLDRSNLWERTLVVFTSDHGESLLDHESYIGHAFTLYEETLRVPLILVSPRYSVGKKLLPARIRSIDLAPTILEMVNIPLPEHFRGESIKALIEKSSFVEKRPAFAETFAPEGEFDKSACYHGNEKVIRISLQKRKPKEKFVKGNQFQRTPQLIETPSLNSDTTTAASSYKYLRYDLIRDPGEKKSLPEGCCQSSEKALRRMLVRLPELEQIARPQVDKERLELLKSMGYVD